ncbi:DsbA family protein [Leptospira santarosai]|uniref:Thioredoxin n=2 Tax=Leptospira santarosai TaxID=28183 RepID=A0A0E2BID7_9LEPT|nr:DsbA family protein [Leptospira santarosai]AVV79070.1 Thioredoxin [Leptospira santarosai]EKO35083.1 thioredoxin [Leptospira santarosai str. MOR084]EKR90757.1 thioredoxin [Leptospira santarosai str. CBC379]EMF88970.1 thioredoxin [Leptospira santarosai str. ST188]EMM86543.1 thioredoxin [Leptospira santarosai str. 2000027870]
MNQNEPIRHSILYAADPLCPWCYGFGPVLQKVREEYKNKIRFSLVLGGLRFENGAEFLTPELSRILKHEWKDAEFVTKQPFQSEFLDRNDFRYDSFPACKAVISVQKIKPEIAFDYLNILSKSFYHENQDPTSFRTFVSLAENLGIPSKKFQSVFEDKDTDMETKNDFYFGFSLGVSAFPSLVFSDGYESGILTRGYHTYEQVNSILQDYFNTNVNSPTFVFP